MTNRPWFVAVSNTNCERRATQGLVAKGFEVWWPVSVVETWQGGRTSKRRKVVREYPVAPGYLFVRHPNPQAWPEMIGVDGLRAVLCIAFDPVKVSAAEIERWKEDLAPREMPVIEDAYRIGEQVRIAAGPFAMFNATVERLLAGGATEVALSIFGRATRVKMGEGMLEKAVTA